MRPRPHDEWPGRLYLTECFPTKDSGGIGYSDCVSSQQQKMKTFHWCLRDIKKCGDRGKVLDVGGASGSSLGAGGDSGWEPYGAWMPVGVAAEAQEAFGVAIAVGDTQEVASPEGFFDSVSMADLQERVSGSMKKPLGPSDSALWRECCCWHAYHCHVWVRIMRHRWPHPEPEQQSYGFFSSTPAGLVRDVGFQTLKLEANCTTAHHLRGELVRIDSSP